MSFSEGFTREIDIHKPNLADMAQHLEPDERQRVAEKTSGEYLEPTVSPREYLAITDIYKSENLDNLDSVQRRRERAKQLIEEKSNPSRTGFGYNGELSEEEVLETLERHEDSIENPYEVSLDDYLVFAAIRQKAWAPHHDSEEWQDKLSFKEFPGLGTFEFIEAGACRTVYRGPVNGEDDNVIYVPDDRSTPDAYEDDFGNRMAQVAAAVQNKQNIEEFDIDAEFVSDTFEPVIVSLHGEPVPVIMADYREMKAISDENKDKAYEVAEELQKKSNEGALLYHKTGTDVGNSEFIKSGIRHDNLKQDSSTGNFVVADAGEFNRSLDRGDIERLLNEEVMQILDSQREMVK